MKEFKKSKQSVYTKESSSSKSRLAKSKNSHKLRPSYFDISKPAWYVDINRKKYSKIPQIKWQPPIQFELNTKWKVASGEDSLELELEMPSDKVFSTSPKRKWYNETPIIPTDELPDEPESPPSSSQSGEYFAKVSTISALLKGLAEKNEWGERIDTDLLIKVLMDPLRIGNLMKGISSSISGSNPGPSSLVPDVSPRPVTSSESSLVPTKFEVGPVHVKHGGSHALPAVTPPDPSISKSGREMFTYCINKNVESETSGVGPVFKSNYVLPSFKPDPLINPISPGYKPAYGTYGPSFNFESNHAPTLTLPVSVTRPSFRPEVHQSQTWNNHYIVPAATQPTHLAWQSHKYRPLIHPFNQHPSSMVVPPNATQPNFLYSQNPLLSFQQLKTQEHPPKDYRYYKS